MIAHPIEDSPIIARGHDARRTEYRLHANSTFTRVTDGVVFLCSAPCATRFTIEPGVDPYCRALLGVPVHDGPTTTIRRR